MATFYGSEYGGPATGLLYQDRLVLVGGGAIPDAVVASRASDWTEFAVEDADNPVESDAFFFQQVSSRSASFQSVVQQDGLFLFGDVGESIVRSGPFTRSMYRVDENSWHGIESGIPAVLAGSQVVFVQKGGEDVRIINWSEEQKKYNAATMLTISGSVFEKARATTFERSSGRDSDLLYVVDEDGYLAVASIKPQPPNIAWTNWYTEPQTVPVGSTATPARFLDVMSVGGQTVFLVERNGEVAMEWLGSHRGAELDGGAYYTAEEGQESFTLTTMDLPAWMREYADSDVARNPDDKLRYRFVIRQDGEPLTDAVPIVFHEGEPVIEYSREPIRIPFGDVIEVGLQYDRVLQTLPFVVTSNVGRKLAIRECSLIRIAADLFVPANRDVDELLGQVSVSNEGGTDALASSRDRDCPPQWPFTLLRFTVDTPEPYGLDRRYTAECRPSGWYRAPYTVWRFNHHVVLAGIAWKLVG